MTVDNLIYCLFGMVAWFALIMLFLVLVVWRRGLRDTKLVGFLITMIFPSLLRRKAGTPTSVNKPSTKEVAELKKAMSDIVADTAEGDNLKRNLARFLSSDQIGIHPEKK